MTFVIMILVTDDKHVLIIMIVMLIVFVIILTMTQMTGIMIMTATSSDGWTTWMYNFQMWMVQV